MEKINFRTDMADERVDEYKKVHNLSEIDGIKVASVDKGNIKIATVDVLNEKGKEALNKDIGKYITIELNDIKYLTEEQKKEITDEISDQIKILIGDNINSIMVVGLGNEKVTPDSLGPKVTTNVNVTRHMLRYYKEVVEPGTREISALSPGVLGTTGIETEEIVEAVTGFVKPDLVIVIDSLASKSVSRLGKTIQLGNTGITPGAGVGNRRHSLNKENLGINVIAIGVPLVVDMATITNDAIEKIEKETNILNTDIKNMDKESRFIKIANVLDTENFFVTPKEIDDLVTDIAKIIGESLNIVL